MTTTSSPAAAPLTLITRHQDSGTGRPLFTVEVEAEADQAPLHVPPVGVADAAVDQQRERLRALLARVAPLLGDQAGELDDAIVSFEAALALATISALIEHAQSLTPWRPVAFIPD